MRRKIGIALGLIGVLVVASIAIIYFTQYASKASIAPHPTPPIPFTVEISTSNSQAVIPNYPRWFNVSQGRTLTLNLTLKSKTAQLEVPISLEVAYYNSTIKLGSGVFTNNNYSELQERTFTYSLSNNPIILPAAKSNSSIITMQIADNAALGEYMIKVHLKIDLNGEVTDGFAMVIS